MAIDTSTPEGRNHELRNISLMLAKKRLEQVLDEVNYLIMATATGDRRNTICDANIHLLEATKCLGSLTSEEA